MRLVLRVVEFSSDVESGLVLSAVREWDAAFSEVFSEFVVDVGMDLGVYVGASGFIHDCAPIRSFG